MPAPPVAAAVSSPARNLCHVPLACAALVFAMPTSHSPPARGDVGLARDEFAVNTYREWADFSEYVAKLREALASGAGSN